MKGVVLAICVIVCLSTLGDSLRIHGARSQTRSKVSSIPEPKTYYIEQYLDHFNSRETRTYVFLDID